jgi:hypothetical protein
LTEQTAACVDALTARELIDDPVGAFGGSYTRMETSDPEGRRRA